MVDSTLVFFLSPCKITFDRSVTGIAHAVTLPMKTHNPSESWTPVKGPESSTLVLGSAVTITAWSLCFVLYQGSSAIPAIAERSLPAQNLCLVILCSAFAEEKMVTKCPHIGLGGGKVDWTLDG